MSAVFAVIDAVVAVACCELITDDSKHHGFYPEFFDDAVTKESFSCKPVSPAITQKPSSVMRTPEGGGCTLIVDEVDFVDVGHAPCFPGTFHHVLAVISGDSSSDGAEHMDPFGDVGFVGPGVRVIGEAGDTGVR